METTSEKSFNYVACRRNMSKILWVHTSMRALSETWVSTSTLANSLYLGDIIMQCFKCSGGEVDTERTATAITTHVKINCQINYIWEIYLFCSF